MTSTSETASRRACPFRSGRSDDEWGCVCLSDCGVNCCEAAGETNPEGLTVAFPAIGTDTE